MTTQTPEGPHLNNLEQARSEQMLATMDTMQAAGIPNFLVTIDKGPKRIVVLNQPSLTAHPPGGLS